MLNEMVQFVSRTRTASWAIVRVGSRGELQGYNMPVARMAAHSSMALPWLGDHIAAILLAQIHQTMTVQLSAIA